MRTAICNRTYRNAGNDQARANVIGTDVLRKDLAGAFFVARHVVRHPRGVPACLAALHVGLTARRAQAKQASASAARLLERERSSMPGSQRWLAERGSPRAFVTSG
jgi:hypothetical protein